jgi:hypothetical protein
MRKLNILKACIDLAFYLSCLTAITFVVFIPFAILGYMDGIPINMQESELIIDNWQAKLVLFFVLISSLFFLYGIYLLRKTIALFIKKDLFNVEVIKNFNTIGICVVTSTLLMVIPSFLYNAFYRTKFGFKIEAGFDSPLLVVSLGLFFMVLSEVFKIAKHLKEENDLTL